MKNYIIELKS